VIIHKHIQNLVFTLRLCGKNIRKGDREIRGDMEMSQKIKNFQKYFISLSPRIAKQPGRLRGRQPHGGGGCIAISSFMFRIFLSCFFLWVRVSGLSAQNSTPDEQSMFGTDQPETKQAGAEKDKTNKPDTDTSASAEAVDNPLQVGGSIYYRFIASPQVDKTPKETPISLPLQVDGFFDGRPNDRIRVYIDARLLYDATRDKYSQTTSGTSLGGSQTSSTANVSSTTSNVPNNPQVLLDQAWLKFDISRAVFFTGGTQHVKWGTSRFWNPTDFINTQKRDPLLQQDLRLGIPMMRFDVPWQALKSNFTAIGFFDQPKPASTLGQIGGAARFESVFGETEIGIDIVYRDHETYNDNLVYGADFSTPLGPFDLYGEAACITRAQSKYYKTISNEKPATGANLSQFISEEEPKTPIYEVSTGMNYTFGWLDNRQATVGAEYFYNQSGYENSLAYPVLIVKGLYQPFYMGIHYAAIYVSVEGPDSGKHTNYTFSVLSNLSDKSLVGRIDFTWNFLTYMTFEMFAAGHFGKNGGEFNFSLDTPLVLYQGSFIPPMNVPATSFDAGLALRTRF
jgi:hypothetical protein